MNKPKWKEWTESNEQRDEIKNAPHGYILRFQTGFESAIQCTTTLANNSVFTHYLICQPQKKRPHDELRTRWELTGQPIWWRVSSDYEWEITRNPSWDAGLEYTSTPPEARKEPKIEYFIIKDQQVIERGWKLKNDPIVVATGCGIVYGETV